MTLPFKIEHARYLGVLLIVAVTFANGTAQAEPGYPVTTVRSQVIPTGLRSSTTGAEIVDITLSQSVSFSDLDVTSKADMAELVSRVETTARHLCRAVDAQYPLLASSTKRKSCINKAVRGALAQLPADLDKAVRVALAQLSADLY